MLSAGSARSRLPGEAGARQRMETKGMMGEEVRAAWQLGRCALKFINFGVPECVEHNHTCSGRQRKREMSFLEGGGLRQALEDECSWSHQTGQMGAFSARGCRLHGPSHGLVLPPWPPAPPSQDKCPDGVWRSGDQALEELPRLEGAGLQHPPSSPGLSAPCSNTGECDVPPAESEGIVCSGEGRMGRGFSKPGSPQPPIPLPAAQATPSGVEWSTKKWPKPDQTGGAGFDHCTQMLPEPGS